MATKEKKEKKSSRSKADKVSKTEVVEKIEKVEEVEQPKDVQEPVKDPNVDEPGSPDNVDMTDAEPASSKRKIDLEEIEVDVEAPEPPSKRAKRALKKGKALPAKQGSDDEGEGKEKDKKTRSEHGVWIGNLPFYLTNKDLRKWFVDSSGGSITDEMITRVKLPMSKLPGRDKNAKPNNKGFAYVDFTDIGAKVAAIALTEAEMGGRKLLVKDSKSFEGRPEKEKEPAEGENGEGVKEQKWEINASRKIFVGNMSFKTTEDDLRRQFEKCGEIEWVKVATFEDTGKCKGFGWVMFKEAEGAAWAVKGFVKIKEAIETEQDFKSDDEEDEEDKSKAAQQKQFKTRKWWVNRLLGRELKIELAEDDQLRYKKRFGKERPKEGDADSNPRNRPPPRKDGWTDRSGAQDNKSGNGELKPLKEAQDINVARLTGAVVKHTGSKMTFD